MKTKIKNWIKENDAIVISISGFIIGWSLAAVLDVVFGISLL